jgi:O-antigen/teichoic acid export membrane protein
MRSFIKNIYTKREQFLQDLFWRALQVAGKQGVVLLIFIICAKVLVPVDFGVYSYITAFVAMLIIFSDFGISTAVSRFTAEYQAIKDNRLNGIIYNAIILVSIAAGAVSFALYVYTQLNTAHNYTYIFYILPLLLLAPISSVLDGVYRGLQKFKQSSIISLLSGLFVIPVAYLLILQHGIQGALMAQWILYLAGIVPMLYFQRHLFERRIQKSVIKQISFYGFHVGVATIGYFLFSRIDVLILGHYGYFKEIATYELLNRILAVALVPVQILAQVVAPRFSILRAHHDYRSILGSLRKYAFALAVCGGVFYLVTPFVMRFVMGNFFAEYDNVILVEILGITVFIYALNVYSAVISTGIITPTGYAKILSVSNLFLAAFNFVASIVLLKLFGYVGVIYATIASNIIGILITQGLYYTKVKKQAYAYA